MTVYSITDTKRGTTGLAPTYVQPTPDKLLQQWLKLAKMLLKQSNKM